MVADVTLITPHIPPRVRELERAVASVARQSTPPTAHVVLTDYAHRGAAATRNAALGAVETEWVAFLDDDDELLPNHLEALVTHAELTGADVVYPGCRAFNEANGVEIPRKMEWGRYLLPFDADLLRRKSYIPVTSLVRAELANRAFFDAPDGTDYDDWGFYLQLLALDARFVHLPKITWTWYHDWSGKNTSGRGDKW